MPKRQTSLLEDLIISLMKLPWWGCLISAVVFWGLGQILLPRLDPAEMNSALFAHLTKFFFNGFAILCVFIAPFAALKSLTRRKLLDQQKNIDSIRQLSWREFEQLVGEAYRRQGYEIEETGGGGADGGIDLILRRKNQSVLVQCKQWKARQVGVDKVRELFGVVTAERANHGILVTSGSFTRDAIAFQVGKPLTLTDGPALAQLVQTVQSANHPKVSVSVPQTAQLVPAPVTTDPVCPLCSSPVLLRIARRGTNAGTKFFGCPRYPACKALAH